MSFEKLTDQQALIPMMSKLMKELTAIISIGFKTHKINLSKEQAIVLKKLSEKDGRPQSDLALVTSRDKTSLTRLLSTMESKRLISRKQSKNDKRVNLVYITRMGRTELKKASPIVINIFNQAIEGIDIKRIEETKSLLTDIYENLNLSHEE